MRHSWKTNKETIQNGILWLRIERSMSFKEIASALNRSLKTIQYHWGGIVRRAGSGDPFDIYRWAVAEGIAEGYVKHWVRNCKYRHCHRIFRTANEKQLYCHAEHEELELGNIS